MGKLIDLTGQRFGRLTVIERSGENTKCRKPRWVCMCDCGKKVIISGETLRCGHSQSCGCFRNETNTRHGMFRRRLYHIWGNMKYRCYNETATNYNYYGGRGITVCDEWLNDFMSFYKWAMANGYDDTKSIDRIDNDKGYSPDNCRWATPKEQDNNKRNNRKIRFKGKVQTISEWAYELGIPPKRIGERLRAGWTPEEALTTPKGEKRRST